MNQGLVLLRTTLVLCALVPLLAHGQSAGLGAERGLDAVSFKPALGADALLSLNGLEAPLAGRYHLSAGLDLAEGLMALKVGSEKIGNLVKRQWTLRLAASYAPTPRLEIAAELPLVLYQANAFDLLQSELGFYDTPPASTGMGDLRVLGRFHFWPRNDRPIGLAAALELRGLTGETESFLGERGLAVIPAVEVEFDPVASLRLVGRVGYQFRTHAGRYLNLYQGDEFLIALGAAYRLPRLGSFEPELLSEILIASPARAPFTFAAADALKTPMELFVGLRTQVRPGLGLRVGVGRGLSISPGFGREAFRLFAMLSYRADVTPAPVRMACDVDQDGLADDVDRCPRLPGPATYDGCPDTDQDEIPDLDDACPQLAGPARPDGLEGCPAEGELAIYQAGRIVLLGSIRFDSGRATLRPDSSPTLNAVATILNAHPELKRLRVDGHTDDQGPGEFNLELSRRRAQAVVKYLIGRKVDRKRLTTRGFGESEPVADNGTSIGRARNRRVVFTVLERAGDATSAPTETQAPTPAAPATKPEPVAPTGD